MADARAVRSARETFNDKERCSAVRGMSLMADLGVAVPVPGARVGVAVPVTITGKGEGAASGIGSISTLGSVMGFWSAILVDRSGGEEGRGGQDAQAALILVKWEKVRDCA